jgi:hypothetical protein
LPWGARRLSCGQLLARPGTLPGSVWLDARRGVVIVFAIGVRDRPPAC